MSARWSRKMLSEVFRFLFKTRPLAGVYVSNNIYTCQKYIKQQKQLEESFMGDYIRLTALGSIVPESRAHLGALEKKKDYKQRADDHHRKEKTLKLLRKKALNRNPDEFYFNMVNTVKKDGLHQRKESTEPDHTEAQMKLMFSQDLKYVNMKRSTELKKIERLKSALHLIDCDDKPKNKHTIFVDSKKEVKNFDAAKYFKTHPALVNRTYNRPKLEALKKGELAPPVDDDSIEELANERKKKYKELKKRIEREKELHIIAQKMERKKQLTDTTSEKKQVTAETKDAPAQYKWKFQRKR